MLIDVAGLAARERYRLMTQVIVPRPVAWVLSDNGGLTEPGSLAEKRYNLAPYSYFAGISSNPALLMFSVGKKPDTSNKDTLVNIQTRRHFVVHIAHRELATAVTETSRTLAHGESELERAQLTLTKFDGFALPRLEACRVALGCKLHQTVQLDGLSQTLVFGEILHAYVADSIIVSANGDDASPNIDLKKLDPIGRLGGNDYTSFGDIISVPRPK